MTKVCVCALIPLNLLLLLLNEELIRLMVNMWLIELSAGRQAVVVDRNG